MSCGLRNCQSPRIAMNSGFGLVVAAMAQANGAARRDQSMGERGPPPSGTGLLIRVWPTRGLGPWPR